MMQVRLEKTAQSSRALMALRSMILSGEFEYETRLREVALSEQLGISRTPLRHAMQQLVEEGLIERLENGSCRVRRFSTEDILDGIELRGVLEGTSLRLAAERGADSAILTQIDSVLAELDLAVPPNATLDFDAYVQLNAEFHELLAQISGSPVISREVRRIMRLPVASPSAFLNAQELLGDFQSSLKIAQAQHRSMIEAVKNREGARAEALAREHARLARQNLEYITKFKPSLADSVPGLALLNA